MSGISLLQDKLKDARSKRVIFVSHCLLNENTRYLGGATRKGAIFELIEELKKKDVGIVQMKCPEQKAWGGVLKKEMLRAYGAKDIPAFLRKIYLNSFISRTKKIYSRIAFDVAGDISDYIQSGYEVVGIIGVKGSPSCGVSNAIDIKKSAEYLVGIDVNSINKEELNKKFYRELSSKSQGLFIEALKVELAKKKLDVPFFEHDLPSEIEGEYKNILGV